MYPGRWTLFLRMLFDEKLAQSSYLVACQRTGEALVIDPNRNLEQYLDLASSEGFKISAVTETHIHADFASGAAELAERTGATLYLSDEGDADWKYGFAEATGASLVHDGDIIPVGNIRLQVVHTPGHTPEHISFILTDKAVADQPMGIFSGDFVFVGDVGRPDLLETAAGLAGTMETGARQLFASLQKFRELPDHLQVWPGHGAGSACGKALGAVPQSTVGYEKLFNWALNIDDENEFVRQVTSDQPEPPTYFKEMKRINRDGVPRVADATPPERLGPETLTDQIKLGLRVIDIRPADVFAAGHVPGTINIPYGKAFITWAGWLVSYEEPFALIVDEGSLMDVVRDLQLIGLDDIAGYWTPEDLAGQQMDTTEQLSAAGASTRIERGDVTLLDVRGSAEYREGHISEAIHIPLGYLEQRIDEVPDDKAIIVHCLSGYRSAIAASILHAHNRGPVINMSGGYQAWTAADLPVER